MLASLACGSGSDNTGQKVGEVEAVAPAAAESTKASPSLYAIGDIIQLKDHTIVPNSVEFTGGVLTANFTVNNTSTSELAVSSLLSFSARDDDGTKLEQEWMCSPGLDGSVLAGDKLRGNLCFKTTGIEPYKLYYEASLFGSGAVVWQVEPQFALLTQTGHFRCRSRSREGMVSDRLICCGPSPPKKSQIWHPFNAGEIDPATLILTTRRS